MWICPQCGEKIDDQLSVCWGCGRWNEVRLPALASEPTTDQPEAPIAAVNEWHNPWVYVMLLAIFALAALFMSWGGKFKGSLIAAACLVVGPYGVAMACTDSPWFWHTSKALRLVGAVGKQSARVFYVLLGLGLFALGAWLAWESVPNLPW